jgi:NADH-quinone oxidoreductase subunit J
MHPLLAATIPDITTFVVCALLVLGGAFGVVLSRNPVHSALFAVAVLFVEQDAQFLAVVQVIVYAGAIVVLFLFVIMLIGVDRVEQLGREPLRGQRLAGLLVGAMVLAEVLLLATVTWPTGAPAVAGSSGGPGTNVAKLGRSVFTTYLLPFEVTSILLVIAVIGAVVLARRPRQERREEARDREAGPGDPALAAPPVTAEVERQGAPPEVRVGAPTGEGAEGDQGGPGNRPGSPPAGEQRP